MNHASGVLLCTFLGACGARPPILQNWNFNFWRGAELVGWQVLRGDVRRAPTWYSLDYGVEMLGNDTALSQRSTSYSPCMRVDVIADIEPTASVVYEVDFYDDGVVDVRQQIPVAAWAPVSFSLRTTETYGLEPIRFTVTKSGDGHAVLANMHVQDDTCTGTLVVPSNIAGGRACDRDQMCASGRCIDAPPSIMVAEGELPPHVCDQ